ncbi:MAG: hypothetical protein RRY10_02875 [Christensenellaceae bacterium]
MSMKIVVINGSERKGSTYHFTQLLIEQMEDVQATEFFLPKDMPQFFGLFRYDF